MSVIVTMNFPEGVFSALRKDPEEFAAEMRVAAAIKWYEVGEVSQERAAEIAGLSRQDFLKALNRFHVTPFQYSAQDVIAEAAGA